MVAMTLHIKSNREKLIELEVVQVPSALHH